MFSMNGNPKPVNWQAEGRAISKAISPFLAELSTRFPGHSVRKKVLHAFPAGDPFPYNNAIGVTLHIYREDRKARALIRDLSEMLSRHVPGKAVRYKEHEIPVRYLYYGWTEREEAARCKCCGSLTHGE